MLNRPRNVKYKKTRKGKLGKLEFKANKLSFGEVGLKAAESGVITSKQIEAARQAIVRKIKRKGKVWIKIFPDTPITKKSTGVRMGKGKGPVSHWGAKIKSGTVLFEICGVNITTVKTAFNTGQAKLPVKTKIFK